MPDAIRATGGSLRAHPRGGGFLAVAAVFLHATPARATLFDFPPVDSTIADFTGLNQPDVAGLALTLGILLFAVVTAVMLVRTRSRAAQFEIAAREETIALKASATQMILASRGICSPRSPSG